MKVYYKQCPSCNSVTSPSTYFCPSCNTDLSGVPSVPLDSVKSESNSKIIALTVLATVGFLAILGLAYYIGSKSSNNEIAVQTAQTNEAVVSNKQVNTSSLPPEFSATPNLASTNLNTNLSNANTTKLPKKESVNKPEIKQEQMRRIGDGFKSGWSYLTQTNESEDGYYFYYKPDSIRKNSSDVEVWARKYPMYPKGYAKKSDLETLINESLINIRFFCERNTFYVIDETSFDDKGSSISERARYRTSQSVVPGTVIETLKETVCSEE